MAVWFKIHKLLYFLGTLLSFAWVFAMPIPKCSSAMALIALNLLDQFPWWIRPRRFSTPPQTLNSWKLLVLEICPHPSNQTAQLHFSGSRCKNVNLKSLKSVQLNQMCLGDRLLLNFWFYLLLVKLEVVERWALPGYLGFSILCRLMQQNLK